MCNALRVQITVANEKQDGNKVQGSRTSPMPCSDEEVGTDCATSPKSEFRGGKEERVKFCTRVKDVDLVIAMHLFHEVSKKSLSTRLQPAVLLQRQLRVLHGRL